jgi:small subunit ribosomal protein S6
MPLYETVFIARQDLAPEDVDVLTEKFSNIIIENKGKVINKEYWGLRDLAYPIKKNNRGHYILINIEADFEAVAEMKRVINYSEDVIRSTTFKVSSHQKESEMFLSKNAKDYKSGKVTDKKEPSKIDLILDQMQFEI